LEVEVLKEVVEVEGFVWPLVMVAGLEGDPNLDDSDRAVWSPPSESKEEANVTSTSVGVS